VALKMNVNGQYVVTSKKQAIEALVMMHTLKDEIAEIRKKAGLDELEQDAVELKKAVTGYCVNHGVERLDFEHDDDPMHGTLVKGYDRTWLLTDEDFRSAGAPVGAKSLRRILRRKFGSEDFKRIYARITKRVLDPEELDALVTEGVIDADEIAPAFVEKPRTPYLRIFND